MARVRAYYDFKYKTDTNFLIKFTAEKYSKETLRNYFISNIFEVVILLKNMISEENDFAIRNDVIITSENEAYLMLKRMEKISIDETKWRNYR